MFSIPAPRPPPCLSLSLPPTILSHELIPVQSSAPPARAPPPRPPFSRAQVVVTAPSAFATQLSSPSISRHMASAAGDKGSPTNYAVPFPRTLASAAGVTGSPSSPNPTQTLSGAAHVPVSATMRYHVCSAPPLESARATHSTTGVTHASSSTSAWNTPIALHHPATLFSSTPHAASTTTPPLALPTQTQTVHKYAASVQTFPLRTTNLRCHSERAVEGSLGPGEEGPRMSGGDEPVPWSHQTRGPWDVAIMSQMIQHSPLVAYSPGPNKQARSRAVPTCTTKEQEASPSASTTPPGLPPTHFDASAHRLGEGGIFRDDPRGGGRGGPRYEKR